MKKIRPTAKGIILNKEKLGKHLEAAGLLAQLKDACVSYLKNNPSVTEYEAAEYIRNKAKEVKMSFDKEFPIVAFRENTSFVHYFPKKQGSKRLQKESLVLLDMWAQKGRGAIFSDITWMIYYGKKIPAEVLKVGNLVFAARDKAIDFVKRELKKGKIPSGHEVDAVAREKIFKAGYGKIPHSLGHCIGTYAVHGRGDHIAPRFDKPLLKNVVYTIEPGIYLKDKFGFRSEIDFYVDSKMQLVITTVVQKEVTKITA